jgi:hypothetical protein
MLQRELQFFQNAAGTCHQIFRSWIDLRVFHREPCGGLSGIKPRGLRRNQVRKPLKAAARQSPNGFGIVCPPEFNDQIVRDLHQATSSVIHLIEQVIMLSKYCKRALATEAIKHL